MLRNGTICLKVTKYAGNDKICLKNNTICKEVAQFIRQISPKRYTLFKNYVIY